MAFAAPAIAPDNNKNQMTSPLLNLRVLGNMKIPASEVSRRDNWGNGEIMRFEMPYDANSSELTPATPTSGLAMPISGAQISMQAF